MVKNLFIKVLTVSLGVVLVLVAISWASLYGIVENQKASYGVYPSPQEAFQAGFSNSPLQIESVPITYAGPEACDHYWFVLSQGHGIGGGSSFVETDEGWVHFPEVLLPPQVICLGLHLLGIAPN